MTVIIDGEPQEQRSVATAMKRGFLNSCPNCGNGRLFHAFAKPVDHCEACGEAMHHQRADDFPAYLVVFIVGHIIVGAWMGMDALYPMGLVATLSIWIPATLILAILLLQPVKGAVIGMQWALRMHGFGGHSDEPDAIGPEHHDS